MFRLHALAFALVLFLAISTAALADSGSYIGGSAGGATFEASIDAPGLPDLPEELDEDDNAWKVFAGYRFDLPLVDLAVEGGYVNFGQPDIDVGNEVLEIENSGINLWGVGSFGIGPVDLFGKLGLVYWDSEANVLDERFSDSSTDIAYGLGAGLNLGSFQIRGEYEIYDLDDADLAMRSLGVVYRF